MGFTWQQSINRDTVITQQQINEIQTNVQTLLNRVCYAHHVSENTNNYLTNRAIPHYSGHQQTHYTNHYNQKHSGFHSGYQSSNQTSHLVSYQSSNKSTHMNYNQISINYGECQAFNGTDHNTYYSTHYNFDDLVHHVQQKIGYYNLVFDSEGFDV